MEDYILAENIIRIGTIHAAVPYTDTHKEEKIPSIWNVKSVVDAYHHFTYNGQMSIIDTFT